MDDIFTDYAEEYESRFPLLQELCERNLESVLDELAYIIALYGMAIGYLSNLHPSTAFGSYALECTMGLGEISESGWSEIQLQIANKLEERANDH